MSTLNIPEQFRKFILGNPKNFPIQEYVLDYLPYCYLNKSKFRILVHILVLIYCLGIMYFAITKWRRSTITPFMLGLIIIFSLYITLESSTGAKKTKYPDIGFLDFVKPGRYYSNIIALMMKSYLVREGDDEVHMDEVLGQFRRKNQEKFEDTPQDIRMMEIYNMESRKIAERKFKENMEREKKLFEAEKAEKIKELLKKEEELGRKHAEEEKKMLKEGKTRQEILKLYEERGDYERLDDIPHEADVEYAKEAYSDSYFEYGDESDNEGIKAETEKKKNFLIKIQKLMRRKKKFESQFEYFMTDVNKTKIKMDKYMDQLKANYFDFMTMSQKIEQELVGVGVYLHQYFFVINSVKDSIDLKFSLFCKNEKKSDDDKKIKGKKSILNFKKENPAPVSDEKTLIHNIKNFYKNMFVQEKEIKKFQTRPQDEEIETLECLLLWTYYFFMLQGGFALFFLAMFMAKIFDVKMVPRSILLIFLTLNLFFGVFMMPLAQFYDKKCITKDISTCNKKKDLSVDRIILQLNEILGLDEKTFDSLESTRAQLVNLTNEYKKKTEELNKYLTHNAYNQIGYSFAPARTMFAKIKFVKNDFDMIMKNKVNKKEYFFLIARIETLIENIENLFSKPSFAAIMGFYQYAVELNLQFATEKESLPDTIQDLELDDAKKMRSLKKELCQNDLKKVCKGYTIFDRLYLKLLVISPILIFLVAT